MTYSKLILSLAFILTAGSAIASGQAVDTVSLDGLSADQLSALASVLGGAER